MKSAVSIIGWRTNADGSLRSSSRACPGLSATKLSQPGRQLLRRARRSKDFYKSPGVAEPSTGRPAPRTRRSRMTRRGLATRWARLLKYQDDIARMQGDTLQTVLKEGDGEELDASRNFGASAGVELRCAMHIGRISRFHRCAIAHLKVVLGPIPECRKVNTGAYHGPSIILA